MHRYDGRKYHYLSLYLAFEWLYKMFQGRGLPTDTFLERFQNAVDVIMQYGGTIGEDNGSVNGELALLNVVRETGKSNSRTADQ